jgi:hypothetical protein
MILSDRMIKAARAAGVDAATVLNEALAFATIVDRVLPVDHEMDRLAAQALRKRAADRKPRKLSSK